MQIKNFQQLVEQAVASSAKPIVAVVEAHDEHTLEAVIHAKKGDLIDALLIGNKAKICEILLQHGENADNYQIVNTASIEDSLSVAVSYVNRGLATSIMKGKLETAQLLKAILNKENNLLEGSLLSIVGLFEHPNYHKLLAVTDQGLNIRPDVNAKKSIIINAVKLLQALGIEKPKVALLSAIERVNQKMPDTVEAHILKEMNIAGEIKDCIVEGPISFDLAIKSGSASVKGFESPVAGDADILVVPEIVSGNILVKCMTDYAGALTAGAVVGAKVPIIVTSRSASANDKYFSIALAAYLASKK